MSAGTQKEIEMSLKEHPYFLGENGSIRDASQSEDIVHLQQVKSSLPVKFKELLSEQCSLGFLKRRLPIISWLPKYSLDDLKGDLIAGITVALTVIPQGLALAMLARLPPQYGLYTAFMGCFVYTIFGSCKDLTIGPTAVMSLMTAEHTSLGGITYVILLTFLTGCIQLAMGILNLGFLVTFISSSVVSAFTSAAAITIAVTQISGLFGIKSKSETFLGDVYNFFIGLKNGHINYWDMTMGLASIIFLLILKYLSAVKVNCHSLRAKKIIETFLQTLSTARYVLLVLICTGIVSVLLAHNIDVLTLTQQVQPGLPNFTAPVFTYDYFNNATNHTVHKNFLQISQEIGSALIIIPLIGILEAIAVAKSFAKGKRLDATQEMIAIGICNIMGSFVSSYPTTGSFSRTAINYSSGVRTTAGGIFTGSLVLLALAVMSPYFHYIPKASLCALIFIAVLNMVHYKDVIIMWRANKLDLVPFVATFILSFVLGLEYGITIGIGISLLLLLFHEARPKITLEERKTYHGFPYLYAKPDRTVLFPSAEYLQSKIVNSLADCLESKFYCIVVDGENFTTLDYTTSLNIKNMINNFKKDHHHMLLINMKGHVRKSIEGTSPDELLCFSSQQEAEYFIDEMHLNEDNTI